MKNWQMQIKKISNLRSLGSIIQFSWLETMHDRSISSAVKISELLAKLKTALCLSQNFSHKHAFNLTLTFLPKNIVLVYFGKQDIESGSLELDLDVSCFWGWTSFLRLLYLWRPIAPCFKLFPLIKFWGMSMLCKTSIFCIFLCRHCQKIQVAANLTILKPDALLI